MLVGHNTLRLMTMGMEDRPPEPHELAAMIELLEEALAGGALGLSSGLFTAPGCYAEGEELVALGRVLKRRGARYFTHLRDESDSVFDSVEEAIEFAVPDRRPRPDRPRQALRHGQLGRRGAPARTAGRGAARRRRDRLRPVPLRGGQQPAAQPVPELAAGGRDRRHAGASRQRRHPRPAAPRGRRGGTQQFRPHPVLGRGAGLDLAGPAAIRGPHDRRDRGGTGTAIRSRRRSTTSPPTSARPGCWSRRSRRTTSAP